MMRLHENVQFQSKDGLMCIGLTGWVDLNLWDQKSCQLSKFDSVLVGHGTKNANKP